MINAPFAGTYEKEKESKQCKQEWILVFIPDFSVSDKKRNVDKQQDWAGSSISRYEWVQQQFQFSGADRYML